MLSTLTVLLLSVVSFSLAAAAAALSACDVELVSIHGSTAAVAPTAGVVSA